MQPATILGLGGRGLFWGGWEGTSEQQEAKEAREAKGEAGRGRGDGTVLSWPACPPVLFFCFPPPPSFPLSSCFRYVPFLNDYYDVDLLGKIEQKQEDEESSSGRRRRRRRRRTEAAYTIDQGRDTSETL
jgi:hypothetical protein